MTSTDSAAQSVHAQPRCPVAACLHLAVAVGSVPLDLARKWYDNVLLAGRCESTGPGRSRAWDSTRSARIRRHPVGTVSWR